SGLFSMVPMTAKPLAGEGVVVVVVEEVVVEVVVVHPAMAVPTQAPLPSQVASSVQPCPSSQDVPLPLNWHVVVQQEVNAPFAVPSSHCSGACTMPSPQTCPR